MTYQRGQPLYEGKAKSVYTVQGSDKLLWLEFKDSLTAFNALKKGSFINKGGVNLKIASLIFRYLKQNGINTHWVEDRQPNVMISQKLQMIPLEVVVRNVVAGSLAKKLGQTEGGVIQPPLVELYLKNDELQDPFINDEQALFLKAAAANELPEIKKQALRINELLLPFFSRMNIRLVDFKLEFGRTADKQILLADEISPDSCRLWDMQTNEKLDKDRFRRDLGQVEESYQEVLKRIEQSWESEL